MIVDKPIRDKVYEEAKSQGCYFVNNDEKMRLENTVTKGGKLNPDIVGKPAAWIANYAGFTVPEETKILVAECSTVGKNELLSMEKLSPMLSWYVVDGWLEGCHRCIELLNYGGIGHTMAIHSNDKEIIMKFALEKPAFRVVVNTPSSVGAVGYTTDLIPSMTLGPGTWGGSIISENVSAMHLMNIKTLAFETNPVNVGNSTTSLGTSSNFNVKSEASPGSFMQQIEDRLRARAGNVSVNPNKSSGGSYNKESKSQFGKGISEKEIQKIIEEFNSK